MASSGDLKAIRTLTIHKFGNYACTITGHRRRRRHRRRAVVDRWAEKEESWINNVGKLSVFIEE